MNVRTRWSPLYCALFTYYDLCICCVFCSPTLATHSREELINIGLTTRTLFISFHWSRKFSRASCWRSSSSQRGVRTTLPSIHLVKRRSSVPPSMTSLCPQSGHISADPSHPWAPYVRRLSPCGGGPELSPSPQSCHFAVKKLKTNAQCSSLYLNI